MKTEQTKANICFILDGEYPFDPRVEKEAISLVKCGYLPHIICKTKKKIIAEERIKSIQIHRIKLPIFFKKRELDKFIDYLVFPIFSCMKLRKLHRKWKFDSVVVANPPDNLLICLNIFTKYLKINKVVNDFHDPFSILVKTHFNNSVIIYLAKFFEKLALVTCDEAITVNELCEDILRKNHNRRISVVKNYPSSEIKENEAKVQEIHKDFGDKIAVFVGNLIYQNGAQHLIEAGINSKEFFKEKKIKILIVGGGNLFETLKKRIDDENVSEFIRLLGNVDHETAMNFLAASSVVIVPISDTPISRIMNPNKLFEAIYFNKPIIISDLDCFKSIGSDAFIYFKSNDHKDLAKKILCVFENMHKKTIIEKIELIKNMKKDMVWEIQSHKFIDSVT
jgi:glycosyltransferase involved in cell wall biosynthesis